MQLMQRPVAGARIHRSVLFEYARVGAGAELDEMIVSSRYCVDRSGKTRSARTAASPWHCGDVRKTALPALAGPVGIESALHLIAVTTEQQ